MNIELLGKTIQEIKMKHNDGSGEFHSEKQCVVKDNAESQVVVYD